MLTQWGATLVIQLRERERERERERVSVLKVEGVNVREISM